MTPSEFHAKEKALKHAIQTGVKMLINKDPQYDDFTESQKDALKHHRVGIDSALAEMGGLIGLLVEKGVFTTDDYRKHIIKALENEVIFVTARVNKSFGPNSKMNVTLA